MGATRCIIAGSLIDGSGGEVRRNVFLEITDTIITAISSATDLPRHDGAAIDDFSHCIIVPALVDCSVALVDCSVALSQSPSVDSTVRLAAEQACRFSIRYVAPGKSVPGAEAFWQKMLTSNWRNCVWPGNWE